MKKIFIFLLGCFFAISAVAENAKYSGTTTSVVDAPSETGVNGNYSSIKAEKEKSMLVVDNQLPSYAGNPNECIGKVLKSTGMLSMSIGVPCVVAGVACLMYANFKDNPTNGYTTSKSKAESDESLKYITVDEWNSKMQKFTRSTHNAEVAGYILTPMGGALTIIGVPLYVKGKKMMKLDVNYTGNGAGVSVEF